MTNSQGEQRSVNGGKKIRRTICRRKVMLDLHKEVYKEEIEEWPITEDGVILLDSNNESHLEWWHEDE